MPVIMDDLLYASYFGGSIVHQLLWQTYYMPVIMEDLLYAS